MPLDTRWLLVRDLIDRIADRELRLEGVIEREDVDCCISVLLPGLDVEIGLGDDDDAADAEGVELVEDDVDDGGLGSLRRLDQGFLHRLEAVDHVGVAIEQLDQQVPSQGVQSSGPPFSDPVIYRTSPATRRSPRCLTKKFLVYTKTCFTVWPAFFDCKKKTRSRALSDRRTKVSEAVRRPTLSACIRMPAR